MKQNKKQINKRMIAMMIAVMTISFFCYFYWESIRQYFRMFLCSPFLRIGSTILIFSLYSIHFYKVRMNDENFSPIISRSLPPVLDQFLTALTYSSIISTSIILLKGLFLQFSYNEEYFKDFGSLDIGSLAIFIFIPLWYCINNIVRDVKDLFWEERNVDTSKELISGKVVITE